MPGERPKGGEDVLERKKSSTKRPRRYQVLLHNDDYTTMDLVVHILMSVFNKARAEAIHVMLTVHHKGRGVAGVYDRDVAETKVAAATGIARDNGAPLKVTMEPA